MSDVTVNQVIVIPSHVSRHMIATQTISCIQALAGVCRDRSFGGLGDVAVTPMDLARRVFLTADTGDASAPSVVAITF